MRDTDPADVISVLKAQHAEIRRAFIRAAMPGSGQPAAFRRLVRLLAVHEAAEEAHVHPTVRHISSAAQAAKARLEEERRAKRLLVTFNRTGPDGKGYLRTLWALRRVVLSHAAREEKSEFPALAALSRARRGCLARKSGLPGTWHRPGRTRMSAACWRTGSPYRSSARSTGAGISPTGGCRATDASRRLYIAIRGTRLSWEQQAMADRLHVPRFPGDFASSARDSASSATSSPAGTLNAHGATTPRSGRGPPSPRLTSLSHGPRRRPDIPRTRR
jgi:hemerythrin superfamily protein